jgi:hypothetical protein
MIDQSIKMAAGISVLEESKQTRGAGGTLKSYLSHIYVLQYQENTIPP